MNSKAVLHIYFPWTNFVLWKMIFYPKMTFESKETCNSMESNLKNECDFPRILLTMPRRTLWDKRNLY